SPESLEGVSEVVLTTDDAVVGENCAICMEEYKVEDECYKLACGHYLHKECGRRWLQRAPTCPICRAKLASHDESSENGHSESSTFSDGRFTRHYESSSNGFS
ncbi:conserved hypothetical protein, partial [Perkinsus marinus ATCC 50983]